MTSWNHNYLWVGNERPRIMPSPRRSPTALIMPLIAKAMARTLLFLAVRFCEYKRKIMGRRHGMERKWGEGASITYEMEMQSYMYCIYKEMMKLLSLATKCIYYNGNST